MSKRLGATVYLMRIEKYEPSFDVIKSKQGL